MKKGSKKQSIASLLAIVAILILTPLTVNAASRVARKDGQIKGCTVWFTKNTPAYSGGRKVATIKKGKKATIVKKTSSNFIVKYGRKNLSIDSTYVLINAKEYIPSLDIRLSMAKKSNYFSMGGKKISGVSNKKYYTSKGSENGTECWVRFKVAQQLLKAQKRFAKDGVSIVIYDAYRPYSVTQSFKTNYRKFLNKQTSSWKNYWFGKFGEGWFLAQSASAHNYGRAIDMTLKCIANGKLLTMPCQIHTLDKRAAYDTWMANWNVGSNNAYYMKMIMEQYGFTYLRSEWWHFQINSIPYGNVIDLKI